MQELLKNGTHSHHNDHQADQPINAYNIQPFLNNFCELNDDISEGVVVLKDDEDLRSIAQWPHEHALNTALSNTIDMAIKRQSGVKIVPAFSENIKNQACILAVPIIANQRTLGVIALAMKTANNKVTTQRLVELQEKANVIASLLIKQHTTSRPADANKLILLQQVFLAQPNLEAATIAVVNELANLLKFERVCIGVNQQQQVNMVAMSNQTDFINEHEITTAITSAMEEANDQLESITFPPLEHDKPHIHIAHQALHAKTNSTVCCIPLIHQEAVIGTMSLEHQNQAMVSRESMVWFEQIANYLAPLIAIKMRAEQPWLARTKQSVKDLFAQYIYQENRQSSLAVFALFILLILSFIPTTYHVGAHAHIEGATQRIMSAPVEGYIQQVYVKPGDTVKKGTILVDLADQDLILEKQKWEAEIVQQENNFSGALARQDRTEYAVSQAKAAQARSELALIKQELNRAHIKAPIDGIILDGDLSQSLGAPVKLGEKLMTIAPENEYRLIIEVDERDINDIHIAQKGTLALSALPSDKVSFVIKRITPVAMVSNGMNTYAVEATLLSKNTYLRPGLQGIAKINANQHFLIWNIAHRLIDWFRLGIWKWGL